MGGGGGGFRLEHCKAWALVNDIRNPLSRVQAEALCALVNKGLPLDEKLSIKEVFDFSPNQACAQPALRILEAKAATGVPFSVTDIAAAIKLLFETEELRGNLHLLPQRGFEEVGVRECFQARWV